MILLIFVRRCRVFSLELMSIEVPGSSWKLVSTLEGVLVPRGGYWLSQALTSNLSSLPIRFVVFMFAVHSTCHVNCRFACRESYCSTDAAANRYDAHHPRLTWSTCYYRLRWEGGKKGGKLPFSTLRGRQERRQKILPPFERGTVRFPVCFH